jgi:hypothetical protein
MPDLSSFFKLFLFKACRKILDATLVKAIDEPILAPAFWAGKKQTVARLGALMRASRSCGF